MRRRRFLRVGTAAGTLGLAGCFGLGGGNSSPPPRKAEVYDSISTNDGAIVVNLTADPTVESRADVDASLALSLGLPVGRAAAAKGGGRGQGATGRGSGGWSSAPHRGGRAIHHGHEDDDDWREEHENEISRYDAAIAVVALGYMGSQEEFSDDPPPAGPLDESQWDERWTDPEPDQQLSMPVEQPGWYRVGSKLRSENGNQGFGWESVDFRVDQSGDGYEVENPWQVSPRL
ncbi:hypothetical protein NDI56_07855 [Haloarcula sp. S1CR25-12]|uniref:Tat (Twin-arginine translocation) pathway signal sequence n=1 Tax=Haloarcula saliterrae TaxID=2950534 RepID=A0ABU2FAK7_9EURY|nr:hypothetical protein [Haloarcula sp. S1CR25-12]MDS0259304.1 hypothetical protein [Haloarcula sp. S1CR25-12]